MLINDYKKYKQEYSDYITFIKSGTFYISFNNDAYVMHNIFNYQIKKVNGGFKVGFPIQSIEKIEDKLKIISVNYIIVEDENIKTKKEFKNNNYSSYTANKNYSILYNRIDNISNTLKKNVDHNNIESIIYKMENILCEID